MDKTPRGRLLRGDSWNWTFEADAARNGPQTRTQTGGSAVLKMIVMIGGMTRSPHPEFLHLAGRHVRCIDFGMIGRVSPISDGDEL